MTTTTSSQRRHTMYLDQRIQQRLLWLLVLMELLLVFACIAYLYTDLKEVIDNQIYRIHFGDNTNTSSRLLAAISEALALLFACNLLALVIADRVWARYVNRILGQFRTLIERTRQLNLSRDDDIGHEHEVIDLALAWRQYEHQIWLDVREELAAIPKQPDLQDASEREAIKQRLRNMRIILSDENPQNDK